ncbi:MAG: alkylated DNA repair dioxygenase AlkB [Planctomycetota bacterium]|jgi:alkylated DNA repair dioxygenase AlkB
MAEVLELPAAQVLYWPQWLAASECSALFESLRRELDWRQDELHLFGKRHALPRLQAWHGDAGAGYSYSGMSLEAEPWSATLEQLRAAVTEQVRSQLPEARFNSVLANLYRHGRDSNGWHADDEPELGERPVLASLSLGATRRFRLRHRQGAQESVSLDLAAGSLLVMYGDTQAAWQHCIPKTARAVGERINLTFRQVQISASG